MSETLRDGVERLVAKWDDDSNGVRHVHWSAVPELRALLAATAPTPDEVGLVEVLAEHRLWWIGPYVGKCSCKQWRSTRDALAEHDAHLARAVQAYTEQRVGERVAEALEGAARAVEHANERLYLDGQVKLGMIRAARIVREQAPTTGGGE